MARKKKVEEVFIPSKYQQAILDFVQSGQGNAVIEAQPGSGKSRTLLECLKVIPEGQKILVTAFNNDIVEELKKKIKKEKIQGQIDCRTIHSLGYSILMSNLGKEIDKQPNEFKYPSYIYNNIKALGGDDYASLSFNDRGKYVDNVKDYVNFGRYYLCQTVNDLTKIETKYNIPTFSNEKEVALQVMEWGKQNYQTIDFTDMIWLPLVLNCKPYGHIYDWILNDESQDDELQERELLLKCTKMSTRMLIAGQKMQSIYGFKGTDSESFDAFKSLPNTISLPLSISYRCDKNIVKLANRFDSQMEARADAEDGEIKYNVPIEEIEDGSMVLCRVNAPLLQMYTELAKLNKPATIRGKDIGANLIKIIKSTKQEYLYPLLNHEGVFSHLYNKLFTSIDVIMRQHKITFEMAMDDMGVSQEYDTIQALEAIADGLVTTEELIEKISTLFSDKKAKGIQLSTIHKSKGLEADNVYICCPSLMPSQSAKDKWEMEQEMNLMFVAYTRAKHKLGFLTEDNFTLYSSNAQQKAANLAAKKVLVFNIYGSKNRCGVVVPNKAAAKAIIANAKPAKVQPKTAKVMTISDKVNKSTSSLSALGAKKKVKRRIRI